tara:strand:+ start:45 stop:650 length:606 start_codon:yes stop_codon:yes gene_type:complete
MVMNKNLLNRQSMLKSMVKLDNQKKDTNKEYNRFNYYVLTSYILDNRKVKFDGQFVNSRVKDKIIVEFVNAGFKVNKDKELLKMTQTKINLFSRIYSHKKVQELIKDCKDHQSVLDVLETNKLNSQGKLKKFIEGKKEKVENENDSQELTDSEFSNKIQEMIESREWKSTSALKDIQAITTEKLKYLVDVGYQDTKKVINK